MKLTYIIIGILLIGIVSATFGFDTDKIATPITEVKEVLQDFEVVNKTSASDSNDKTQSVTCPTGKILIAGGCSIISSDVDVSLQDSHPVNSTSWECIGTETDPVGTSWTLIAYASCVNQYERVK